MIFRIINNNGKYELYDIKTGNIFLILEIDGNLQILLEYNNIANLLKDWLVNIININPLDIEYRQFNLDNIIAEIKQKQREQKINNLLQNDNTN